MMTDTLVVDVNSLFADKVSMARKLLNFNVSPKFPSCDLTGDELTLLLEVVVLSANGSDTSHLGEKVSALWIQFFNYLLSGVDGNVFKGEVG